MKKDLSYELIKGSFTEYIKVSIDASKVTTKEIKKLIEKYADSGQTVRIEFSGTETECKTISKEQFAGTGIDIKLKYDEIYDACETAPGSLVEKYTKEDIINSFKDFCKEKKYELDFGLKLLEKFLNK